MHESGWKNPEYLEGKEFFLDFMRNQGGCVYESQDAGFGSTASGEGFRGFQAVCDGLRRHNRLVRILHIFYRTAHF